MKTTQLWIAAPLAAALAVSSGSAQQYGSVQPCGNGQPCGAGMHCGAATSVSSHDSCWENQIWPNQYIQPSRRGICQAFETMTVNGWRQHNLLGQYHYDATTNELTEAGRLKVQWVATQAPPHRRSLYVARGADQQQTAARVAAAQQLAVTSTFVGPAPEVYDTHVRDEGRPAGAIDAMFTGFRAGQMAPTLPQSSTGGGTTTQ